ncbi:unnamed protein product, partial [Anisakis simplex]|uniref:Protein suppressor of variegation 3-7 n=1 Tax=Anisakis simplex TaxID=6269 RepID=A0A0M3JBG1_ANISI
CASDDEYENSAEYDEDSLTNSDYFRIYFAQRESDKLQRRLEKHNEDADEKSSLLLSHKQQRSIKVPQERTKSRYFEVPHSVSQYQSLTGVSFKL